MGFKYFNVYEVPDITLWGPKWSTIYNTKCNSQHLFSVW